VSQIDVITGEAPKRYAQALLELAVEAKSLKTVEKDVKTLKAILAKSEALTQMASSPVIAVEDKVAALTAISKKAKVSKLTTQFIGTVTQNRRASEILLKQVSILTCSVASSCVSGPGFMIAPSRPNLRI